MPAGIRVYLENSEEGNEESCSQTSKTPDRDFSPQLKRLRTPQPNRSPTSRFGGKRRSSAGGISEGSPASAVSLMSQPSEPDPASVWNCGACTYSNSSLLPYCEMCECPRSTSAVSSGKSKEQIISNYPIPPQPIPPPTCCLRLPVCPSSSSSAPSFSLILLLFIFVFN